MDSEAFLKAVERAKARESGGIGTLAEKTLHSALKYYYEPDETKHEAPLSGFFADILNADGVTEIQTGSFFHIDRKLGVFLEEYPVTLVCPVIRRRRIIYLDPETGEMTAPRLSPKKGRTEDVFRELVHIRKRLADKNLLFVVPLIDADEYRVKREPKRRFHDKGYDKYELVPTELYEERVFAEKADWLLLLPEGLDGFTVKELESALGLPKGQGGAMARSLLSSGALTREKRGSSFVYYRTGE
ncbi:MAG: hypothetical protein K6F68_08690 [Clostridiales bacterium]|nr:hypothetical protein [Clostridiales bacterium]